MEVCGTAGVRSRRAANVGSGELRKNFTSVSCKVLQKNVHFGENSLGRQAYGVHSFYLLETKV
jgi:hypothetical protein